MSTHNIHGLNIEVTVSQGDMTDQSRGRCIGRVVNLCRDMPADDFVAAVEDMSVSLQGTPKSAALLESIDKALAQNYTPKHADDFAPIASLKVV